VLFKDYSAAKKPPTLYNDIQSSTRSVRSKVRYATSSLRMKVARTLF